MENKQVTGGEQSTTTKLIGGDYEKSLGVSGVERSTNSGVSGVDTKEGYQDIVSLLAGNTMKFVTYNKRDLALLHINNYMVLCFPIGDEKRKKYIIPLPSIEYLGGIKYACTKLDLDFNDICWYLHIVW